MVNTPVDIAVLSKEEFHLLLLAGKLIPTVLSSVDRSMPNIPIEIPHYIIPTQYPTRNYHPYHYILPYASTTYYQQSFFQRRVKEWNNLPLSVINSDSLLTFSLSL